MDAAIQACLLGFTVSQELTRAIRVRFGLGRFRAHFGRLDDMRARSRLDRWRQHASRGVSRWSILLWTHTLLIGYRIQHLNSRP